jgi:CRP-like cAMP-binding protein
VLSSDGRDALTPNAARFLAHGRAARQPGSPSLFAYLLDLDDDLAQQIEVRMRFSARQHATVRLLQSDPGECDLSRWFEAVGPGPGLLITEGLMTAETEIAERRVTELLGVGDLLQPPQASEDEMIGRCSAWRALRRTRLALLDAEFLERVRAWPQLQRALFRRAERRTAEEQILRAISCHPKLDVRLILLLWHLAGRWGRVEPTGIRLSLPLTHRMLGQLVAAERPSVSHALGRLAHSGIVTGQAGDWHLHGDVDAHVESLIDRTGHLAPSPQPGPRTRRHIA